MASAGRNLLTGFLVALATVGGTLSMQGLVQTSSWFASGLGTLGVSLLVVALARTWTSSVWIPTAIGGAVGLYVMVAIFAPGRGALAPLPGLSSAGDIVDLARQGVEDAATSPPPVLGSDGLALWVVAAMLLVFLLAELLAVGCQAPAWSGLALLAPWAPAVALEQPIAASVFVLSAAGYLGLLVVHAATRADPADGTSRGDVWASATGVAAGATALAVIAAPAVLHLPTPDWQSPGGGGGGGATRLDLGLDVSEQLIRGADDLLYTYAASDPADLGPLHAYTVTDFNGSQWFRGPEPDQTEPAGSGQVLWPEPIEAGPVDQRLDVHVLDLAQDRLLLPDQPRRLAIDGDWAYDAATDEVIGSGPTPLDYEVDIFEIDLDPVELNAAGPVDPDDADPATLGVPDTGHQEQIAALAQRVTDAADAQTPYEQAVAIQDFFREDSQFTYDLQVDPARTSDAVWDFLGSGRGYCVQFASAMVMLARSLDIPARMAVGFLEGEENDDGVIEVSGHRAHTWPQLYFDDVGWVRFEPTPPARTGEPPQWAAGVPADAETPETSDVPDATADTEAPEVDDTADGTEPGTATDSGQAQAGSTWASGWGALAVVLVVLVAALAWHRRRGRGADLERSWALVHRAATEVRPERAFPGETPRGLTSRLALPEPAAEALKQLAGAVELHRYAPPGQDEPSDAEVRRWRDQVLTAIREQEN